MRSEAKNLPTRQKPLNQILIATLLQTADTITRGWHVILKNHGLTVTQYRVLVVLRGAGSRGASNSAIREPMIKLKPDVTRLLDRMERRGWVWRERSFKDRRSVRTVITADGLMMLSGLDDIIRDQNLRPFSAMSVAEIQQLIASLEKVQRALRS